MHLLCEFLVRRSRQSKDGVHAHLHSQTDQADDRIRISEYGQALAVEVRMSIGHHVHQAATLVFDLLRYWDAHEAGD